jgi:hypothetical protein
VTHRAPIISNCGPFYGVAMGGSSAGETRVPRMGHVVSQDRPPVPHDIGGQSAPVSVKFPDVSSYKTTAERSQTEVIDFIKGQEYTWTAVAFKDDNGVV